MRLFKNGNLEVKVVNMSPHNIIFDLRIGDEELGTITLSQNQTTTDIIPIKNIEGITEEGAEMKELQSVSWEVGEVKRDVKKIQKNQKRSSKTNRNYFIIGIGCAVGFFLLGYFLK